MKTKDINHLLLVFVLRISQQYEEISGIVRGTPKTTEELVFLVGYIKKTSDVTVHKLIDEVHAAVYRLSFLMNYATLSSNNILRHYVLLSG